MRTPPLTPSGSQKPDEKYVETEIILERRRSKRFKAETEDNLTAIGDNITSIEGDVVTINENITAIDESIVEINGIIADLADTYVQSVPIREIVVMDRTEWDSTTPDPDILYCVYDV